MNNKYCGKCGNPNDAANCFCTACGAKLTQVKESNANFSKLDEIENKDKSYYSQVDQMPNEEYERDKTIFIRNNAKYYVDKFHEMDRLKNNTSWNWAACLFTGYWFCYRKMYKIGIGFTVVLSLSLCLGWIRNFLLIGIAIYSGFMADYHYKNYVEDEVIKAQDFPDYQKNLYFKQKGGTNVLAIFIAFGLAFSIGIFLWSVGLY